MRVAPLVILSLVLLPALALADDAPEWTHARYPFELRGPIGAPWRITLDANGQVSASVGPAVCASDTGPCATNTDACTTSTTAPACDGATNALAPHEGPFTLLGFTGTIAASATGGVMTDRLVYSCTTHISCVGGNTVEFDCTFAPGTVHLVEVWATDGGDCAIPKWDSALVGNTFTLHGSQDGDLTGTISHTVN